MSRFQSFAVFAVLLGFASGAAYAGDVITYADLEITSPTLAFNLVTPDNVTVSGVSSVLFPGYTLSAEFCENAACNTPITTTDQSLLRFTNMTLTCTSESACGLIDINFEADGATYNHALMPVSLITVGVSLDGVSTDNVNGSVTLCITNPHAICTANLSGPHSFQTNFSADVSGTTSGSLITLAGFTVYGQIEVDALAAGKTVTLMNSLDISIGSDAIPEPATIGLVAGALLLLGLAYWRKAANASKA